MKSLLRCFLFTGLILLLFEPTITTAQSTVIGRQINGFTEEFAPSNWVFTPSGPNFFGSIDASNSPSSILFLGSDDTRNPGQGQGGGSASATYSIVIPFDGTLQLDYSIFHSDDGFDFIEFQLNGITFLGTLTGSQSSSININLSQGDVFTIRSSTVDNILGAIDITISNLVFGTEETIYQGVPNQITYVSPINTSTNLETSQELVWEPIVGAMSYVVEVSSNTNFDEAGLIFQSNDYEGTTLSLEDLNNQTTYFWRVRPNMPGPAPELEDWMTDDPWFGRQYRMFRTKMETITEFSDDSACLSAASGQISWPTSTGAKTYNLQVATNPEMENPVYEYKTLSSNTFTFRRYEPGTYYWRVRAQGNSAGGDLANWSEVQSFTVIPSIEVSGSTTFCEGGSVMLTAPAGMGLQWFKDGEAIEGATEAEYTATESGVYHVGLSTEAECDYTSESITVIVDPLPEITFNASTNQVCAGGTATLLVEGAYPAQWYKDGVAIGGNGQNSLVVSESGSYTVEVTSANGCKLMSEAQVIEVLPTPELAISANTMVICEGGEAIISSSLDNAEGLTWYRDGAPVSNVNTVNWTVNAPGTYHYGYTNTAGCTYYSEEITVTQIILPTPEITVTANHQEMLSRGYPVALFSSAAPAGAGYQWVVNGEILTGINGRGIAILGNATVTVSFVTEAGCIANSETFNVTYPAGVQILNTEVVELTPAEIEYERIDPATVRRFDLRYTAASGASAEAFQAFPNPTEGVMNVVISKNLVGQATMLSIRSILGTEVMTANLVDDGGSYTASFDLGAMRNGLYVLQVEGSTGVYRKTVKKE
ncbi:T9SS type A sorting domain-containing protein [Fulvivirgaceae bacterium LMO-SS25]